MESVASKGAHTPGPWVIGSCNIIRGEIGRTGYRGRGIDICQAQSMDMKPGEADANARLIAAAPDLAEACRMAEHAMTGPRGEVYNRNTIDAITRALGKAGVL